MSLRHQARSSPRRRRGRRRASSGEPTSVVATDVGRIREADPPIGAPLTCPQAWVAAPPETHGETLGRGLSVCAAASIIRRLSGKPQRQPNVNQQGRTGATGELRIADQTACLRPSATPRNPSPPLPKLRVVVRAPSPALRKPFADDHRRVVGGAQVLPRRSPALGTALYQTRVSPVSPPLSAS